MESTSNLMQVIQNFILDAELAGKAMGEITLILSRTGLEYKSLPLLLQDIEVELQKMIANGMYMGFATEAELLGSTPEFNAIYAKADDTKQTYRWDLENQTWVPTGLGELEQAIAYVDEKLKTVNVSSFEELTGEEAYRRALDAPSEKFHFIWKEYGKLARHVENMEFKDSLGVPIKVYDGDLIGPQLIVNQIPQSTTINPVLSGIGQAGLQVIVKVNSTQNTTIVTEQGTWAVGLTLGVGTHVVEVSSTNEKGATTTRTTTIIIDAIPVIPRVTIDTLPISPIAVATVTGTGQPNQQITVTVGSFTYTPKIGSNGRWSITTDELPNNSYRVVATQRDTDGFTTTAEATLIITVDPKFVFKIKLLTENQLFRFPTRNNAEAIQNMTIDWGDGQTSTHTNYDINHQYVGAVGTEFTITVRGSSVPEFDCTSGRALESREMIISIEENTLPPRSMTHFKLNGCINLKYFGAGAFTTFSETTFRPNLANYQDIIFHKDAFRGLEHVTNIDSIFGGVSSNGLYNIPAGLFDYFINVTSAADALRNCKSPIPVGLFDKMVNLEQATSMFFGALIDTIDNRIFKNQKKLKNVSFIFRGCENLVADAFQLYTDMNQGNPSTVNGAFVVVPKMTNISQVPMAWRSL